MIIICIRGRLGNQLFQVALGMHLEKRGQLVKYDLSATENGKLAVLSFPPLNEYLEARLIKSTKFFPAPFGRFGLLARLCRRVYGIEYFFSNYSPHAKPVYSDQVGSILDGFWQREEYSQDLASFVEMSPWFNQIPTSLGNSRELVVHIRRGDFIKLGIALDMSFYTSSIKKIVFENPEVNTVAVVTDDPNYCRNNLDIDLPFKIYRGQSHMDDFTYLIQAQYILISRSTFSWWAARFSSGKVYYPAPWNHEYQQSDTVIIPGNWNPIFEQ